jgi:hypothetical protein
MSLPLNAARFHWDKACKYAGRGNMDECNRRIVEAARELDPLKGEADAPRAFVLSVMQMSPYGTNKKCVHDAVPPQFCKCAA